MSSLIYVLIVGAISGWLAGQIKRGFGFGLLGNIIVGIVGAFVGNWIFGQLGVSLGAGLISTILTSIIGALVVLTVIGLFNSNPMYYSNSPYFCGLFYWSDRTSDPKTQLHF
jgi:uncharacterized membrane protein YeaQ/YmgE (transglycosylase-associated protein family)